MKPVRAERVESHALLAVQARSERLHLHLHVDDTSLRLLELVPHGISSGRRAVQLLGRNAQRLVQVLLGLFRARDLLLVLLHLRLQL